MVIKHNTIDNTYLVYDEEERWLILEIFENEYSCCLEVSHYGREEVVVQTVFSPEEALSVSIEERPDKAFKRVVIKSRYPTVSWEHNDDPMIVQ